MLVYKARAVDKSFLIVGCSCGRELDTSTRVRFGQEIACGPPPEPQSLRHAAPERNALPRMSAS